ncbi:MAG: sugar ABC transporter permease [Epulopiscium sp. Nele67-Bin004]|nr:MAG: sugar ABC transporter permease [Epulopiscium sp. Nele67-Bin004]
MNNNKMSGDDLFTKFIYVLLGILGIISLYPFIYVLSSSLSSGAMVDRGMVTLFPKEFTTDAYTFVLGDDVFWKSYGNTIYFTVFGVIWSMFLSAPGAYVLSRHRLAGRRFWNFLLVFTMWFDAGMIPAYLNYQALGIVDSKIGIVLAFGVQAFNIILLRNYFEGIPESLEESAMIDGATDFRIFFDIFLPLSKPSFVTVVLYYAIGRWNGFFWTMVLIRDIDKTPLQVYLRKMIIEQQQLAEEVAKTAHSAAYSADTVIYAIIVASMVPVIIVYPYIQKYFTKGIMVGGVKE